LQHHPDARHFGITPLGGREEKTMRGGILRSIAVLAFAAAVGGSITAAQSAAWWEKNFWMTGPRYENNVPMCHEHGPLDRIMARFNTKENRFWNSSLELVGFENIREVAWEPWISGTIPRRFCAASVLVSDGKRHLIYYSIAEDAGILGASFGVDWCVVGLDRNWAYNPQCKMARP
jgi:hypothetical protein